MAQQREEPEDDEEHLDQGPGESDLGGSGHSADLAECPYCHKIVAEQAQRCHHCGNYIIAEGIRHSVPLWIWIGVIACMMAAILWVVFQHG